jgi:hypothetical protein
MIIKKFRLFEAQDRIFGQGTVFSNNHRRPNLPDNCAMIDIDNVSVVNGSINAIVEDKFKFDSKFLGNPMTANGTWQRTKLVDICTTIGCDLLFHEISTGLIFKFVGNNPPISVSSLDGYDLIETADRIYIEIRYGRPKAVMFRTEGTKVDNLTIDPVFTVALKLATLLNIRLYIVNDVIPDKIYIRKYYPVLPKERTNTYLIKPDSAESWREAYERMGLL